MKPLSIFFTVFTLILISPLVSHGQLDPWYQIENIENLEISVLFNENSIVLKPYYNFHLLKYVRMAQTDPSKKIVIVHKDNSRLSKLRARSLQNFLVYRLQFPLQKIETNSGLPASYLVYKGEKLMVFLRTDFKYSGKPQKKVLVRAPAVKKPDYIYINRTRKTKRRSLDVSLGIRDYSFSNTSKDLFAWALGVQGKKRVASNLNVSFDFGCAFSDSSFAQPREYEFALGLESQFEHLNLNSRVYGRKNWAWVGSDSKFVTVNDLGLHQGLEFKLVRRPSYTLTVGAWAELSLSNTISEFSSANVLSFQTEIIFEWFELNTFITAYRLSRKYKVFDADIVGLSLGYKF